MAAFVVLAKDEEIADASLAHLAERYLHGASVSMAAKIDVASVSHAAIKAASQVPRKLSIQAQAEARREASRFSGQEDARPDPAHQWLQPEILARIHSQAIQQSA
ncbi:hypothetical protein [Bradyrhizobium sp. 164]|uniref:hypothetical protein n=1 Tax=Bradyrhizobium sp. 164 TaxID=2782637 RepID=UPI001FF7B2D8|nr:hypothetical protein [Bradyrhizobium sp. 164]MCK1595926.1 hypothetical protein [Bradyrhizobium sp. 164]